MTRAFIAAIVAFGIALASSGCREKNSYLDGKTYYFQDFVSYKFPFQPYNPLEEQEAKAKKTFYTAEFEKGRVVKAAKVLDSNIVWEAAYSYDEAGNIEVKSSTSEVKMRIQRFKPNGEIVYDSKK